MSKYQVNEVQAAQLAASFTYHPPVSDQSIRYACLRSAAGELAKLCCENCPPSRELSLALTNLEQAVFWANASIARNERPFEGG